MSTTPAGFRAPAPAGPPAVVCLGDSCTFGLGVEDGEAFPAQLGASTNLAVLNAGIPGYSAYQGRRLLEEHVGSWHPKLVVIQFGWNDAAVWDGRSDAEHAILLASGPGLLFRSRLVQLLAALLSRRASRAEGGAALPTRPRLTPEEFGEELRAMVRLSRSGGALPVLVIWPARHNLEGIRIPPHLDVARQVAAAEGAPLVDLFEIFPREGGAALYADAVHANAAGNRAVAAAIAKALRREPTREGQGGSGGANPASPLK
jgi:lysophospholipase L1-like esterase